MRYAVISDIHANEPALRRVLADARENGAECVVCLGDIVGYGPMPAETIELIRSSAATVLAGNHDDAVSGRADAGDFINLAGDAVARHREMIAPADLAWMKGLPYTAELEGAIAAHGDIFDPPKFYYIDDEKDAEANFNACDAQLIFVGHTHTPEIFLTGNSGTVYKTEAQDFTLEDCKRYIVNPGSVGFPRELNGKCFSSYVLYDSEEKSVRYRYLPFHVSSMIQRGKNPRRVRKTVIAAIAAAAAAVAALGTFFLAPPQDADSAATVETKTIQIASGIRSVSANLQLTRDSSPALLRITFKNSGGDALGVESLTVKKSSRKEFNVPDGTSQADFSILKTTTKGKVGIKSFSPALIPGR